DVAEVRGLRPIERCGNTDEDDVSCRQDFERGRRRQAFVPECCCHGGVGDIEHVTAACAEETDTVSIVVDRVNAKTLLREFEGEWKANVTAANDRDARRSAFNSFNERDGSGTQLG